jgi:hypothetical protein
MSDTRQQGQGGQKDDTVEGGPMRVKDRAAEKVGAAQEPLIRMPRSWPLGAAPTIPDPPPPPCLKVERRGGSEKVLIAVDPGALIWTVGEMRPRFRTPPLA